MKLFEITEAIEVLLAEGVDQETGEITPEVEAALDALEFSREEKLLNCALYMQGEILEGEAVKDYAKQLAERARGHLKRAEWLKEYIKRHAPSDPKWKLRDPRVALSWRKSQRVEPENPACDPDSEEFSLTNVDLNYVKSKTTYSLNKTDAKAQLKAGHPVKGMVLRTYNNLMISPSKPKE